ncbi:hypothetical protein HA466_0107020 [Hirschfeldia incana]|nr:hypothetical protein HA466_0107020 [Hirschfeldia incana]KAJ0254160.1 hypothetical protein HA466_0107020 [Hirschfeldia incana]
MGSGNHEVVDISSDEEVDDFDWFNDLSSDSSTDVVEVLSELKAGSVDSRYRKPKEVLEDDGDDDDCVILDCDPDKTTKTDAVHDDYKLAKDDDDDDDDDEVLVVGQKGEIACRDFPHPRHSCAKYSFNSTSHEKYCDMCHCYVCDIPAPCPYWCIAVSSIEHCHANDKEMIWRNQREYFRTGVMPTQPSPKPTTTTTTPSTVTRQISPSPIPNIIRSSHNPIPGNMIGIRPNLSNVRGRHRLPRNHGLQSLISGRSSSVFRKDRSSYISNSRSRVACSGARYGAPNGNNSKVGPYTNAKVSQSTHHNSSVVAPPPTFTAEMCAQQQQRGSQLSVPHYPVAAAVTGSQSNVVYSQFQGNEGVFAPPETHLTTGGLQAQTVQQQQPPGTNDNVLQTELSEFESWLMDSSNQAGLFSPLPEPLVGEDNVSPLTFDF